MSAVTRRRHLDTEREITKHAVRGITDAEPLIEFAEQRARRLSGDYVQDPMLVQTGRNRPRDVREELADARNHLVWDLEDKPASPGRRLSALAHIILAYQDLREDA